MINLYLVSARKLPCFGKKLINILLIKHNFLHSKV